MVPALPTVFDGHTRTPFTKAITCGDCFLLSVSKGPNHAQERGPGAEEHFCCELYPSVTHEKRHPLLR